MLLGDFVVRDGSADHAGPILPQNARWREQPIPTNDLNCFVQTLSPLDRNIQTAPHCPT